MLTKADSTDHTDLNAAGDCRMFAGTGMQVQTAQLAHKATQVTPFA